MDFRGGGHLTACFSIIHLSKLYYSFTCVLFIQYKNDLLINASID
jgi:hypothetical protein